MQDAVVELKAHGRSDSAGALAEKAVRWHEALARQTAKTVAARSALARALYLAERWEPAQRQFASLANESPDDLEYQRYLGTLAARLGNRPRAVRVLSSASPAT